MSTPALPISAIGNRLDGLTLGAQIPWPRLSAHCIAIDAVPLIAQPVAGGEQRPTRRRRLEADVCEHMGR
jgi:hypothetical protein